MPPSAHEAVSLPDNSRAMSQENVDVVRRWIDGYNRRDMDGLVELTSPDLEVQSVFEFDFRGYEGLRAYFMELDGAYDDFQVVPSDLIDAGAAVLMVANAKWRGKAVRPKEKRRSKSRSG